MAYQWRAKWIETWLTTWSTDPEQIGNVQIKPKDHLVRRQYKTREAAEQAFPHVKEKFPRTAEFTLEEMVTDSPQEFR